MRKLSYLLACVLISQTVFATEPSPTKIGTEYEYPELLVAPSASERLAQEAKLEAKNNWRIHWAVQSSAALTLFAGMLASSDPGTKTLADGQVAATKTASLASLTIGGSWLAITAALSATYTPYHNGMQTLSTMSKAGGKREQLAYERAAEEALYRPAQISRVVKWASVVTNVAAGGYVVSAAKNDMTKIVGGLAVIGGFLPLMFEHPWAENYRFHEDYKKRIYGPLAYQNVSLMPNGDHLAPAWTVGLAF